MPRKIDISHKTIIFVASFLLGLWIIYLIKDLLLLLFVALIFMSALSPVVRFFESKFKFPKALGILVTYIVLIGIFILVLAVIVPPLLEQSIRLLNTVPKVVIETFNLTNLDQGLLQSEFTEFSKNFLSFTLTIFSNFVAVISLLVLTFYLLLEEENLEKHTASLFVGQEARVRNLLIKIEEKLGAWLRGQLFLSLIIGLLAYLGLTILNIPYALPLALFAGIMEVVPVIGPIVAAIPTVALALTISPVLAAASVAMYFIIQQLENHLIVPQVMNKAVGLNPLVVILAIAVGGRLLGIGGALLAVPLTVVLQVLFLDILSERKI